MKACIKTFQVPKAGNTDSENEDSCWPRESCEKDLPTCVAVADGATDAVYSGLWADILVKAYGSRRLAPTFHEAFAKKAKIWQRVLRHRKMPWYVEEKARMGTYAALIGIDLRYMPGSDVGSWTAVACGDCCLFQIRGFALVEAFPISKSSAFSNSPLLLRTHPMNEEDLNGILTACGTWEDGDSFYLMSDALACWFLMQCESGSIPWQLLNDITLAETPSFPSWITQLRERRELKNDDCTLVSITFE